MLQKGKQNRPLKHAANMNINRKEVDQTYQVYVFYLIVFCLYIC